MYLYDKGFHHTKYNLTINMNALFKIVHESSWDLLGTRYIILMNVWGDCPEQGFAELPLY